MKISSDVRLSLLESPRNRRDFYLRGAYVCRNVSLSRDLDLIESINGIDVSSLDRGH